MKNLDEMPHSTPYPTRLVYYPMLNESVASFYAYHASETPQHQSDRSSSGTQAPSSSASSSIDAATAIVHAHAAKIKLERDDNLPSQQIDQKPAQTPKKKASTAVTPKQLQTLRRHYRRSYDRNASDADRQNERDRVAQIVGVTPTVVSVKYSEFNREVKKGIFLARLNAGFY